MPNRATVEAVNQRLAAFEGTRRRRDVSRHRRQVLGPDVRISNEIMYDFLLHGAGLCNLGGRYGADR